MSKKLNESAMQNELSGSAFFQSKPEPQETDSPTSSKLPPVRPQNAPKTKVIPKVDKVSVLEEKITFNDPNEKNISDDSTMVPRYHDTTVSSYQDSLIENIRKAVKKLGKEAATYRFTEEEKKSLADIVYTYKGTGVRTSENEITRTAINFLVEDYRQNGSNSILARVIERLNE